MGRREGQRERVKEKRRRRREGRREEGREKRRGGGGSRQEGEAGPQLEHGSGVGTDVHSGYPDGRDCGHCT